MGRQRRDLMVKPEALVDVELPREGDKWTWNDLCVFALVAGDLSESQLASTILLVTAAVLTGKDVVDVQRDVCTSDKIMMRLNMLIATWRRRDDEAFIVRRPY